jgi:hypothetical protein
VGAGSLVSLEDPMERIDLFSEGDIVVYKIDLDGLSNAQKYSVIEKKNGKIILSLRGKLSEALPSELATAKELEDAENKPIED